MRPNTSAIPVGLATKLGQIITAIFLAVALVSAVLDGDHSEATVTAMILSVVSAVSLMLGRYAQAVADRIGSYFGLPSLEGEPVDPGPEPEVR
jgi:hypothetical protein